MTILTRIPTDTNPLKPNRFELNFSRLPSVVYFCQTISIPGVSTGEAYQPTPFVDLYAPGDKLIFEPLVITFIVDQSMQAWNEIYMWMRGMTFPVDFSEYRNLDKISRYSAALATKKPQYSDLMVTVLSGANLPIVKFKYYDAFPTSLTNIILSTTESSDDILTADMTLRYSYFDLIQV